MYCDIVVPGTRLDELTYRFDETQLPELAPGDCVSVRLRGREAAGIVVGLRSSSPVEETRSIEGLIEPRMVPAELVDFVRRVAGHYFGRLGETMHLAIPQPVLSRSSGRAKSFSGVDRARAIGSAPAREGGRFGVGVCADPVQATRRLASFCANGLTQGSVLLLAPDPHAALSLIDESVDAVIISSRLRAKALRTAWRRSRAGRSLVVGCRSAVFAPVVDLAGVVVLDEHDQVYKEERRPRFNARDAAIVRARMASCPVLLCDPTPSMETWYEVARGRWSLLDPLPAVAIRATIVDMRLHRRELLSPRLLCALDQARAAGKSAVLYVNRLGASRSVVCRDCGRVLNCASCRTAMALTGDGSLQCRFCGRVEPAPSLCPECGSGDYVYRVPGVEMIAREVRRLRPKLTVATMTGEQTEFPETDVVVGTRAVLGREWPASVGLVAAVRADDELLLPDFRASERLFAVLWRLGWRAQNSGAEFLIQARRPEENCIAAAADMAVAEFCSRELESRRQAGFPPFARLVVIEISDSSEELADRGALATARFLNRNKGIEVFGPIAATGRKPTRRLLVRLARTARLERLVGRTEIEQLAREVRIDIDPQSVI